jgi:hypothetical protein
MSEYRYIAQGTMPSPTVTSYELLTTSNYWEYGDAMRMDLEAVMNWVVRRLDEDGRFADVRGELTGERQAGRAQIRVTFGADGVGRTFLYHVQREDPVHTVARSMVEDTIRTVPQRIYEGIGGRLQPNDVYYPSALGNTPTRTPGEPSGPAYVSSQ